MSYYRPKTARSGASGADRAAPKLVLIASWMDARDAHIAKYITYYQATYPTSTILLIRFNRDIAWSTSAQNRAVQPAASYLRTKVDAGALSAAPREPEILVHAFSNGGAWSMRSLYQVYRRKTGHALPPHAAVYDSCPGGNSLVRTYHAFTAGLEGVARLFVAPVVALLVVCLWAWHGPLGFLGGEGPLRENQRVHNDRTLVRQTNRSYIFSREDSMVDWRHVEDHATDVAAKGIPVRREMFDNSAHVSHMRSDGDRYWKIVTETWEEGIRRSGSLLPGFT